MTKKLTGAKFTGLAALAALLVWAPAAAADSNDDYYLNGLHAYNIDATGGSADLVQIGQQVCGAISPAHLC